MIGSKERGGRVEGISRRELLFFRGDGRGYSHLRIGGNRT